MIHRIRYTDQNVRESLTEKMVDYDLIDGLKQQLSRSIVGIIWEMLLTIKIFQWNINIITGTIFSKYNRENKLSATKCRCQSRPDGPTWTLRRPGERLSD